MNLEIRWALDLIILDQERSISKAAQKRYVSQSAFTRRLQHLEDSVGFAIIERHAKDIYFTELGQILLATANSLHSQLNESIQLIYEMKNTQEKTIKFAAAHSLVNNFFSNYLRYMPIEDQGIKFEMIALNIGEGLQWLKEGKIDFLVSYSSKNAKQKEKSESLSAVQIGETEIIPVYAKIEGQKINYDLTKDFPLLTYSKNAYLRHIVDQVIDNNDLNYHILYETDNAENLKQLVLQGAGVAWLPKINILEELAQNKLYDLSAPSLTVTQNIFIYKNKLIHHALTDVVFEYFKGLGK
ncbi:MAG: LysR substrate-binding domain-containing protein [Acinetobacter sp.]